VHDIANYIVRGKLWDAFESETPVVLLIDYVSTKLREKWL